MIENSWHDVTVIHTSKVFYKLIMMLIFVFFWRHWWIWWWSCYHYSSNKNYIDLTTVLADTCSCYILLIIYAFLIITAVMFIVHFIHQEYRGSLYIASSNRKTLGVTGCWDSCVLYAWSYTTVTVPHINLHQLHYWP